MDAVNPDYAVVGLKRGTIPYSTVFSAAEAKAMFYQGRDAEVVLMAGKADDLLKQWDTALG